MSTRATYKIGTTTFYIHHDGYPSGAAVYFWKMQRRQYQDGRGGIAEAFLRANERAEITLNHHRHFDTDYRYTIEGNTLTVEERSGISSDPKFSVIFSGDWWEFVNANAEMIEGFEPLEFYGGYSARTGSQLAEAIEKAAAALGAYAKNFPEGLGNISSLQDVLTRAIQALAAYRKKHPKANAKAA